MHLLSGYQGIGSVIALTGIANAATCSETTESDALDKREEGPLCLILLIDTPSDVIAGDPKLES